jgi:hypothetical protein
MRWRDRLRTALATEAETPEAADCAHAKTAKTAKTSAEGVLAHLSVLAEGHSAQNGSIGDAAEASTVADLVAACEARAEALAGAFNDPDVQADRASVAAEELFSVPSVAIAPPAGQVEALADAMAWQSGIGDLEKAHPQFTDAARRRLALTNDPMARGLVVSFERYRAKVRRAP